MKRSFCSSSKEPKKRIIEPVKKSMELEKRNMELEKKSVELEKKSMEPVKKIIVLGSFRKFLYILNIFDGKSLRKPNGRINIQNICVAVIWTMMIVGYIVAIWAATWFCFDHNFDLNEVALTTAMLISAPVMAIAYCSIFLQRDEINDVVGHLNAVINARK